MSKYLNADALRNLTIALLVVTSAVTASAQPSKVEAEIALNLEGTIYTIPRRSSADGVLEACGFEFSEVKRDFSTKRGAPVTMVGSFYLRLAQQAGLVYTIKLGLFDGLGNTTHPVAPANAFISAPHGKAPKKAMRRDSDTLGYALFLGTFDDDVVAAYKSIFEKKQLLIGFNRVAGQQDVTAIIDLTVVDANIVNGKMVRTRSHNGVDDFSACVGELLQLAK